MTNASTTMTSQFQSSATPEAETSERVWKPDELLELNLQFESIWPEDVLAWALDTFGTKVAMATGFGPSGVTLMHMISRVDPATTVFYLDTDLLFPQTHELKRLLSDKLGLRFTRVHSGLSLQEQERLEGPNLWRSNPDRCCHLRKVLPLRRFLETREAWITGIRRDQSPTRQRIDIVHWDASHGLVKINPLAGWSDQQIWDYIELNDLPYNSLHDRGYPSLGCIPCTQSVNDGENPRAGRWKGHDKLECGIHIQADIPIYDEGTSVSDTYTGGSVHEIHSDGMRPREEQPEYRKSA